MNKKKMSVTILLLIALLACTFAIYKFMYQTRDLLTSQKWIDENYINNIKMHYDFNNDELISYIEISDSAIDEIKQSLPESERIVQKIKYNKFKNSFSYSYEGKTYTTKVEGDKNRVVLISETSPKIYLVPANDLP